MHTHFHYQSKSKFSLECRQFQFWEANGSINRSRGKSCIDRVDAVSPIFFFPFPNLDLTSDLNFIADMLTVGIVES